ncbi:MAG TPA: hypothetical protein VFZ97_05095 [Acidimicrobiales bacterium]
MKHRHPTSHLLPELRAQIIFAEPRPEELVIDVLCAPDEHRLSGTAFSLDAAIPLQAWALLAVLAVDRWATLCSEVKLKFRYNQSVAQVSIADEHHTVLLDLRSRPIGLSGDEKTDPISSRHSTV